VALSTMSHDTFSIVVNGERFLPGHVFDFWPGSLHAESRWKYEFRRCVSKDQCPFLVRRGGKEIPVYHQSQTEPLAFETPLDEATFQYLRTFWYPSRRNKYLDCNGSVWTIDVESQKEQGRNCPYFTESYVTQHLHGTRTLGLFAKDVSSLTPWIAIDLDLHLDKGGNLDIFWQQVEAVLRHFWSARKSQVVVSRSTLNGIHLYLYPPAPMPLDTLTAGIRGILRDIHDQHPQIARQVEEWNAKLALVKGRQVQQVAQIADLEIYPSPSKGFRFLGQETKVVLAHRVIDRIAWGKFVKGPKKGQPKYGFDVIGWWESLQINDRMPLNEVLDFIRHRLPPKDKQIVLAEATPSPSLTPPKAEPHTTITETLILQAPEPAKPVQVPEYTGEVSTPAGLGKMLRSTRPKLIAFWSGTWNPKGTFERVVVMTARIFAKEGLSKDDIKVLILKYAKDLPNPARQCSSRLREERWKRVEQDISKAVDRLYAGNANQKDIDGSNEQLNKTVTTWAKYGFRLSDKTTWANRGLGHGEQTATKIEWLDEDGEAFRRVLMPALHVKDPALAQKVATEIVYLTMLKEREGNGWGYKYLAKWLPKMFDIPCSKKEKQQQVFQALQRLKVIKVSVPGKKGRATQWTLGDRARARMEGKTWVQESREELEQSWEEGKLLLDWNQEREEEGEEEGSTL
jgi:hypothetical protein